MIDSFEYNWDRTSLVAKMHPVDGSEPGSGPIDGGRDSVLYVLYGIQYNTDADAALVSIIFAIT